jgi:hypothetical protein
MAAKRENAEKTEVVDTMYGDQAARFVTQQAMASLYAQDQWMHGRLTLQGGLRVERLSSWFPDPADQPVHSNCDSPAGPTHSHAGTVISLEGHLANDVSGRPQTFHGSSGTGTPDERRE